MAFACLSRLDLCSLFGWMWCPLHLIEAIETSIIIMVVGMLNAFLNADHQFITILLECIYGWDLCQPSPFWCISSSWLSFAWSNLKPLVWHGLGYLHYLQSLFLLWQHWRESWSSAWHPSMFGGAIILIIMYIGISQPTHGGSLQTYTF